MAHRPYSAYDIPSTLPLPLGQALRELPGQYLKVLTRPSVKTFVEEKGKANWRIVWVQLIGLGSIDAALQALALLISPLNSVTSQVVIILSAVVLQLLLTPVAFLVAGGIFFLIARAFGGKGTFLQQIYTTLLFGVPLVIVSYLLALIPATNSWLPYVPHIYSLVLMILALVAVHWHKE
jgi:Yip1 domain